MKKIKIYTDGGCIGNPGPGGVGVVIFISDDEVYNISEGYEATTNNQMELLACVRALEFCEKRGLDKNVEIYTDSEYVKKGITEWTKKWKKNGFKTAAKKSVKNKLFWENLDFWNDKIKPRWFWVKGHAGNKGNEMADELANGAAEKAKKGIGSRTSFGLREFAKNKSLF